MVAGGVPDRQLDHAERVAAVALEFRKKVTQIKVPDTNQLPIRIGMSASMIRYDEYCVVSAGRQWRILRARNRVARLLKTRATKLRKKIAGVTSV